MRSYYQVARIAWILLVLGALVPIQTGQFAPYMSPSSVPAWPVSGVAGAVVLAAGGWIVGHSLEDRAWRSAGKEADLSAEGGGFNSKPDLVGRVDGRPVRARTVQRVRAGNSDSTQHYTVVEADMDRPVERGLYLGRSNSAIPGTDAPGGGETVGETYVDDELLVGGGRPEVGEALASGRAREALLDVEDLGTVYVGDASHALTPDLEFLGGVGKRIEERGVRFPTDASTVANQLEGLELDGGNLRRRARAVVAVAEAAERATAESDDWGSG